MQVKRYNIVNPKPYGDPDENGNRKTFWANVGTMTEFHKDTGQVSRIIEMHDSNIQFQVFEMEQKQNGGNVAPQQNNGTANAPAPAQSSEGTGNYPDYPEDDINPDDIPF